MDRWFVGHFLARYGEIANGKCAAGEIKGAFCCSGWKPRHGKPLDSSFCRDRIRTRAGEDPIGLQVGESSHVPGGRVRWPKR